MNDLSFLIPTRIETEDRLRNIISSVSYLLNHFPSRVIVKEVSDSPRFELLAIPEIQKRVDIGKLTYLYEETQEPLFCKSKVLNDLIIESDSKVVANYDADCILPLSSYQQAYDLISTNQVDVVYPYTCGVCQWKAEYSNDIYEKFLDSLDVSVLDKQKTLSTSTIGWTQFVSREKYIDSFMMNENFVSWGCEDDEFYYRMSVLGNRIARVNDYVYHLEHSRTYNSWFNSPNFHNNFNLWNSIKTFDRNQLINYYKNQDYYKKRLAQLQNN